jgi:hypothetical protein
MIICMEIIKLEHVLIIVLMVILNKMIQKYVLKHVLKIIQMVKNNGVILEQDFVKQIVKMGRMIQIFIMLISNKIDNVKNDAHNLQYKHMDKISCVYSIVQIKHGQILLINFVNVQIHVQMMFFKMFSVMDIILLENVFKNVQIHILLKF